MKKIEKFTASNLSIKGMESVKGGTNNPHFQTNDFSGEMIELTSANGGGGMDNPMFKTNNNQRDLPENLFD